MTQKYIENLRMQIEKLDAEKFDLEAWKNYTIILLERIFGHQTHKIRQIEDIRFDFSSWALRDTTGNKTGMDACKEKARKIIEASINELENFGVANKQTNITSTETTAVVQALENNITVAQFREIARITNAKETNELKSEQLSVFLKTIGEANVNRMLVDIILNIGLPEK